MAYLTAVAAVAAVSAWILAGDGPAPETTTQRGQGGVAKHTNRLIHETSPYLLQHAHNPVDWYPWGPEARKKAEQRDCPIFLSIGYAACHWCHVMEQESFEDEQIAKLLNEHFVCIKVDREERPDVDEIYMQATVAMTGRGGWPMSVFLTPEGKPFFAGTYFPKRMFRKLLLQIVEVWTQRRDELDKDAERAVSYLQGWANAASAAPPKSIGLEAVTEAARRSAQGFDPVLGGRKGRRNKFPPSMAMDLMLRVYRRTGEAELREAVVTTLTRMARGGIFDQLGGGFHRYSTDPQWLVPHFEKMLYDQALVSSIYLDAYQLTGNGLFGRVARRTFDYVLACMGNEQGGFYSSTDADSEGKEGVYFLWTKKQIIDELGREDGALFCRYYGVSEEGNFESREPYHRGLNILHVPRDPSEIAKEAGLGVEQLEARLVPMRKKLLAVRGQRVPPRLDDKVLAAWNGLMIASLAKGGVILEEPRYVRAAAQGADFVLTKMRRNGRLLRTYRAGRSKLTAYLDDYAFVIEGLLNLYEGTFQKRWLQEAVALNDVLVKHYWDDEEGGFFYTADDAERLIARSKKAYDRAIPAGNGVQLMNLYRMAILLGKPKLQELADRSLKSFSGSVAAAPGQFHRLLCAVEFAQAGPKEIAIVGSPADPATAALLRATHAKYLPNKVVALLDPAAGSPEELIELVPLLRGKKMVGNVPTAYVCRNYTCRLPVTAPAALARQLQSAVVR